MSLSDSLALSLSDREGVDSRIDVLNEKSARARLTVSRLAAALFWERGVAAASGDDIAAAAGLSTRTIWRYFRTKESCVEPLLAKSADRFLASMCRWPPELSLAEHLAVDIIRHPLSPQDIEDELSAMRIATMTGSEPALRTAYLMVHDRMEAGLIPVIAGRLGLPDGDLTVRLCAAAVTGAFRVIDEDVSKAVIIDGKSVSQSEALALMDRAIREATNGRLGGPVPGITEHP
ncbi:MAG: TetR family transcriptional regulator [Actinobacteria bacterium]|nr:TetR family transcriptional regulator [Actinomycetota bacterium]